MLTELGFGLDLSTCAATGATQDLVYVSPKSGGAVSRSAGEPWRDKLLRLPPFLRDEADAWAAPMTDDDLARRLYADRACFCCATCWSRADRCIPTRAPGSYRVRGRGHRRTTDCPKRDGGRPIALVRSRVRQTLSSLRPCLRAVSPARQPAMCGGGDDDGGDDDGAADGGPRRYRSSWGRDPVAGLDPAPAVPDRPADRADVLDEVTLACDCPDRRRPPAAGLRRGRRRATMAAASDRATAAATSKRRILFSPPDMRAPINERP